MLASAKSTNQGVSRPQARKSSFRARSGPSQTKAAAQSRPVSVHHEATLGSALRLPCAFHLDAIW